MRFLDEAFDEFGLYMVHHNRWVRSATDTTMGERTAQDMSRLITPLLARGIRVNLPRRQVRLTFLETWRPRIAELNSLTTKPNCTA